METIGERLLFLMNLSNIKNKARLSKIIDEMGNAAAIGKAVGDVAGFYLTKRIELKLANLLGWNLHFINLGYGQPLIITQKVRENITALQAKYPEEKLYQNTDLNKYVPAESQKSVDDMSPDELRGLLIKIMYLLKDPTERGIAADIVNKFAE